MRSVTREAACADSEGQLLTDSDAVSLRAAAGLLTADCTSADSFFFHYHTVYCSFWKLLILGWLVKLTGRRRVHMKYQTDTFYKVQTMPKEVKVEQKQLLLKF